MPKLNDLARRNTMVESWLTMVMLNYNRCCCIVLDDCRFTLCAFEEGVKNE